MAYLSGLSRFSGCICNECKNWEQNTRWKSLSNSNFGTWTLFIICTGQIGNKQHKVNNGHVSELELLELPLGKRPEIYDFLFKDNNEDLMRSFVVIGDIGTLNSSLNVSVNLITCLALHWNEIMK